MRSHSLLVHRALETVIGREDVRALAMPHEAVDNYRSVPSLQLRPVVIKSIMNLISNLKLPWVDLGRCRIIGFVPALRLPPWTY